MRWRDVLLVALLMVSAPAVTEFLVHQIRTLKALVERDPPDELPAVPIEVQAIVVEKNRAQSTKSTVVSSITKAISK